MDRYVSRRFYVFVYLAFCEHQDSEREVSKGRTFSKTNKKYKQAKREIAVQ